DYYVNAAHFDTLAPNNPILIVNNPTATTIPAPSPIVTSYSPHTSNIRENPLMTTPTVVSIHSPTPSLVTDDDQDHHHQEVLCRDIQKHSQNELVFQSRSPRTVQNGHKNDKNGLNGQESLKHPSPNDIYGISTKKLGEHLSPVKSDDASVVDELNSTQPTPPPSHQTTPTQKKRRVNKKTAMNNITVVQNTTNNTLTSPIEEPTMSQVHNTSNASFSSTRNVSIGGNKKRAAEDAEETAEEKRRKFLERNRIADWGQDLKNKADSIIAKNNQLHAFVNDLKEEMLALKNQLLAHRNCDCNILQEYIKNGGHSTFERSSAQSYNS
ncbi:16812_t:CDS:2, partial [Racocetra fulgida]